MNGKQMITDAVERAGHWYETEAVFADGLDHQTLVSDERQMILTVTFCGTIVHAARLWDLASENPDTPQELRPSDRDKSARIEAVILGNGRNL